MAKHVHVIAVVRWLTRISGALLVIVFLTFFFGNASFYVFFDAGEGLRIVLEPNPFEMPLRTTAMFISLLVMCGGIILAWFRERAGSLLIAGGFLFGLMFGGTNPVAWPLLVMGLIFGLLSLEKGRHSDTLPAIPAPLRFLTRRTGISLAVLGAVVLVGLSPILLHREIPYTETSIPKTLTGVWRGTVECHLDTGGENWLRRSAIVDLSVHPDGSVSGGIRFTDDGTAVEFAGCVMKKNRGALFRKLNWYTDHVIRGEIDGALYSGDRAKTRMMSLPCNIDGGVLTGTLFTQFEPYRSMNPYISHLRLNREE